MNLYCQLPFGKLHKTNPEIVALASAIGRTPSSVAMKLSNLASLDPVHQKRGVKGLPGASKSDRRIWDEFHQNWEQLSVESEQLREKIGIDGTKPDTSDNVGYLRFKGETDAVAVVRVRRAQRFFRRSVLASYDLKCCITGIGIPELLIASHILPWAQFPHHRCNARNGLCLATLHDAAFDRGLITFDENLRLVLSDDLQNATTNEVLRSAFLQFSGKQIQLPQRFSPDVTFLEHHRNQIFKPH